MVCLDEGSHVRDSGQGVFHQLHPLSGKPFANGQRRPREVATWAREAADNTAPEGIGHRHEDHGCRGGRALCPARPSCAGNDDHDLRASEAVRFARWILNVFEETT